MIGMELGRILFQRSEESETVLFARVVRGPMERR